jgi:hypothetical protein
MVDYVVFGAGVVGRAVSRSLCKNNFKHVICDDKIGTEGVLSVGLACELYPDAIYLVTAADLGMAIQAIKKNGAYAWSTLDNIPLNPKDRFEEYAINTVKNCHEAHLEGIEFMRSLDVVVTERCTLRCRDCSNLMQHYKNPKDVPFEEIQRGLHTITWSVNEVRLIGGEPFLFNRLDEVIRICHAIDHIRYVMVYTNGTLLPDTKVMQAMADCKCFVFITEYEGLSLKANALRDLLGRWGITHHSIPPDYWTDCGQVYHRDRTKEETEKIVEECCAKELYTMIGEKVYRCPFEANAYRAGLIPGDTLACDYCSGRPFDAPKINAAVQL